MPTQSRPSPGPSQISFYDPQASTPLLARLCSHLSAALASTVPALLAESPDPDSALILFDRLVTESSVEVLRLIEQHHALAHYAIVVFGYSRFLGETLLQNTDLLQSFLKDKTLDRTLSAEDFQESLARYRSRSFEEDISLLLARFKRREYVRIMLRDVLQIAPLAETTAELSSLADVLMQEALREAFRNLQHRYGSPQHLDPSGRLADTSFAVLSLGKLGGNELNYSSDLDLFYLYGDGDAPPHAAISNREYFIRLAQAVTETLSRVTREGAVFRIDLRLRPQGAEGELAINLSRAIHYYSHIAHDWERQALIKVRHSAGDTALARSFIREVQPHIYTGEVNFQAIETALQARRRMHARRKQPAPLNEPDSLDVKLGRGGLRDIEFLVQCLQRVYGGSEPWLRSGGTIFSLQKLYDKRHISGKDFHELTNAYEFLRHLEHRLQLRQGQQTHRLPVDRRELRTIHRAMENCAAGRYRLPDLSEFVQQIMAGAALIYERVIHQQQAPGGQEAASGFQLHTRTELSPDQSSRQILDRLAADSPALYEIARRPDLLPRTRANLFRLFSSALTSSSRYAILLRYPDAVARALSLFETSDYLTDILVRYPEELAGLAEFPEDDTRVGSAHLFDSPLGRAGSIGDPVFVYLTNAPTSLAERFSLLRQHYRHRVFAAGARDITDFRDVYESLAVSTATAEDVIRAAFGIAGEPRDLAVMALGRLGSGEFDVLSDADLIFICHSGANRQQLTKAAEQIIQSLAAYTGDGMIFPVDVRLRPHGGEGELLLTPAQLASYFVQEAQAWEALTYTKLRFVAGSRAVAQQALESVPILFDRYATKPDLIAEVRQMRAKIATGKDHNIKTSPGAMYDIDFLAGALLLMHRMANKEGTIRDRLWRCADAGVLGKSDAGALDHAAELFRTVEHVVRLVTGQARKWLPAAEHARQITEKLTSRIFRREFPEGLERELLSACNQVRGIYDRILASAEMEAEARGGRT
jgi:glutamate-ammonia-ligase adenylyltransferase